jgi:predicted small metal-binding protein
MEDNNEEYNDENSNREYNDENSDEEEYNPEILEHIRRMYGMEQLRLDIVNKRNSTIPLKELRRINLNDTNIRDFWYKIFRDMSTRVPPMGDNYPKEFELLYKISDDGMNHINTLNNYGTVTYPKFLYQQCSQIDYRPRSKKDYKININSFEKFSELYIEETSVCRKSKLDDLHMIYYRDKIDTNIFKNEILIDHHIHPSNELSSPDGAIIRMKEFCNLKNCTDILNMVKEMDNVYIVGSSILYSLDPTQILDNYNESDLDICVNSDNFYDVVEKIANGRKIVKKNDRSYKISDNVDIFNSPIGTIAGYHVPMVRGAFDGKEFIVLPSLILAISTKKMFEYRWVKTNGGILEILEKYEKRGYEHIKSVFEKEILTDYDEYENYTFSVGRIKHYETGASYISSLIVISNLDIYDAEYSIGDKAIILKPGEMHLMNEKLLPFKRKISGLNEYLSTIWFGIYICKDHDIKRSSNGILVDQLSSYIYNHIRSLCEKNKYLLVIFDINKRPKKFGIFYKNLDRIDGSLLKGINSSEYNFIVIRNKIIMASSINEIITYKPMIYFKNKDFKEFEIDIPEDIIISKDLKTYNNYHPPHDQRMLNPYY